MCHFCTDPDPWIRTTVFRIRVLLFSLVADKKYVFFSKFFAITFSVADPGCLSRIPDPDFFPSRIPDPKTATKERGEKKYFCHTFLCTVRIIELFTQKIVTKLSKIWVWVPGSGKNLFRIPDTGVKKAPDPGSGSATLNLLFKVTFTSVFNFS
jgi:hypothetical protein